MTGNEAYVSPQRMVETALRHNVQGIAFTYSEPAVWLEHVFDVARQAGLKNVYVYDDKGCDCAQENLPVTAYLDESEEAAHPVKKCHASCCGDEGILLEKYEVSDCQ